MEKLNCIVERITYSNDESGFTVLKVRSKGYADLVTVVGNMSAVYVGSILAMQGEWRHNAKHGRQFAVSIWEETIPASVSGIERYLGSGLIKGVGPKFAKRIVTLFGADTINIIEDEPDRLIEVPGIRGKRVAMIQKAWQNQKEIKNVMMFLQEHNVSTLHAVKIFKAYGNESIKVVTENPYKLADDIWGIGFRTADTIAMKMGLDKEGYYRCRSGLMYVLNEMSNNGHCFAKWDDLLAAGVKMLEIEEQKLHMTLNHMIKQEELKCEDHDQIYLMPLYHSENGTAWRLKKIMSTPDRFQTIDVDKILATVNRLSDIKYDDVQVNAIRQACCAKVMVMTGGPGTGKTTTTKGIIGAYQQMGMSVLLAAPTGRAAKRMTEATGIEAKTIHRLLESKPPEGYKRNADYPLEGDVLIVDESSMIDIVLMYNLLKAVPESMRMLLIGDVDQLPSVGPGNVLLDIINSGAVPVVKLTQIYRQAKGSDIIKNAHRINHGEFPKLFNGKNSDFFFIEENDAGKIPELICDLCSKRLPKHYKVDPISGIQVLTPMKKGETGATNLNQLLQKALNSNTMCLRRGGTEYRLGDKVMQVKNNYNKEVFNGDMGIVSSVNVEDRSLTISFDTVSAEYDVSELDELVLAYASSIHKAQGSEYPIVIMPFTMQHFAMLQRNLLYTGATRAKKVLVLVGSKKAVGYAIQNHSVSGRNTGLLQRMADCRCNHA